MTDVLIECDLKEFNMLFPRVFHTAGTCSLICGILASFGVTPPACGQPNDQPIAPGTSLVIQSWQLSQAPGLCDLVQCPEPPLGGEPTNDTERGTSLFLPFSEMQLQAPSTAYYFRPGDWRLRLEAPNQPGSSFPLELDEFREEHVELGTGVIGDQPGEGVALFFPWPSGAWQSAQQLSLDLRVFNLTKATSRERTYLLRGVGRGGLPPVRLCPLKQGDPRLDVIVQKEPTGFSAALFDGVVDEIVVRGRTATFYVAVVSQLPADSPGVQGWNLLASLPANLRLVQATTMGTVVDGVDVQYTYPTPPEVIHPDTGLPQGEGFITTAVPAVDDPPWTLPPVGTATVLRVTVETTEDIPAGGEATGDLFWRDNMVGADPQTGERTIAVRNNFAVRSRVHYPCTCGSLRLRFRSTEFVELLVPPGEPVVIPDVLAPSLAPICELIECPKPLFGEEDPNATPTPCFSFFIPFADVQLRHDVGTLFFRPGDWELRLEDPRNLLPDFPVVLEEFAEEQVEFGNGVIGDEPGEGIVICFGMPPEVAAAASEQPLDLVLTNHTGGTPRERPYVIFRLGFGSLPVFRLCASVPGDPRLDVIVQRELIGNIGELFAGAAGEVPFDVQPGDIGVGTFYTGIVSDFSEPGAGVQGFSLAASVTGDLRVVSGRVVGFADVARSQGFEVFQVIDPALIHLDTGAPQGEGFVAACVFSFEHPLTLPPRGTATVCEATVETRAPVREGVPVRGRVDWRDGMVGRGQPVPNIATLFGRSFHFCTCRGADLVFTAVSGTIRDCNANRVDDLQEIAAGQAPDCNQNGAPDACDIEAGTSPDLDGNHIPDECGCPRSCETVAESFHNPYASVHQVILGPILITEARVSSRYPRPFAVKDCDQDGDMDLWIPSRISHETEPAAIDLRFACQDGLLPRLVSLRLRTDSAVIVGYDALGLVVGVAAASRPFREQLLALSSPGGIERVEIRGEDQTCLIEICWCCKLSLLPPLFRRADTNGDGRVDISDAVSGLGFLFLGGPAPDCPDAADANDDGKMDISDPVRTLNFLFLGGVEPPAPGPQSCGSDPNPEPGLGDCKYVGCEEGTP